MQVAKTKIIIIIITTITLQVAMIISAITFTQTSVLNYTYFLSNVFRLLGIL